jgi:hypothetical protein
MPPPAPVRRRRVQHPALSVSCVCRGDRLVPRIAEARGGEYELLKARQLSVLSSAYSKVKDADLEVFRSILDEKDVITDAETLVPFNTDWMGKYQGNTQMVLIAACAYVIIKCQFQSKRARKQL